VASLFERVRKEHGKLDILVNNAANLVAMPMAGGFWEKPLATVVDLIAVGLSEDAALGTCPDWCRNWRFSRCQRYRWFAAHLASLHAGRAARTSPLSFKVIQAMRLFETLGRVI
jgi:NAD(P)-dependent dehydrogenase (short-subunit alcohol dehydrogenase family)